MPAVGDAGAQARYAVCTYDQQRPNTFMAYQHCLSDGDCFLFELWYVRGGIGEGLHAVGEVCA